MKSVRRFVFLLVLTILSSLAPKAFAVAADAGHRPYLANVPNANGSADPRRQFREPYVEISNDPAHPTTITLYSVVKKFNNSYGTANQTGGAIFYKGASQNVWQSTPLGFHANEGDFQYWKASFSSAVAAANEAIQYYIYLTFDAGAENTYIFAGNGFGDLASQTTTSESFARQNPFTIRNRPAWVFHANNRVTNGTGVQFWSKVGYIGNANDPATQWVDHGAVYYTKDGTVPAGALGVGSGSTQVAMCGFDHPESNNQGTQSIAGTPMWWVAAVPDLLNGVPTGGTIRYKIGFWNSANNEEKFADHNSAVDNQVFSFTNGTIGEPDLRVNGVSANYTTTHLFVDEVAGTSHSLTVSFEPGRPNVTAVEVFTNLNRRDRAQLDAAPQDGIEDGIKPPDGNLVVAGDDSQYYKAYPMGTAVAAGRYEMQLQGSKTGAYRLTARFKVADAIAENDNQPDKWIYYTRDGRRDHAVVISPVDSRSINLYEVNVLNIESSDNTPNDPSDDFANRSTFEDLYNAPNAAHNGDNRWDLDYLKSLGCNWLWFQPVHPIGVEGQTDYPGSPYAVKNFFEINPLMSVGNTREAAMAAFQGFVSAADLKGVGVMLDAPFNHTAPDAEISAVGVPLFGGTAQQEIRNVEARFFSQTGNYGARASSAGNIAVAPDRGDFGKWNDVRDVFFGNYSALVSLNPQDNGNYANEGDFFDFNSPNFDQVTRNVWKYFAEYPLFWLDKTGVPAGADLATQTSKGIDGLRADFGQGLPPQLWEYIINKTRTRKWNFVFMSESLDGGAVTYRSNRHFDILNENIVFPLASASSPSDYRNIFDSRRNAYGQGLVLLNNTSHDEENYVDPFDALVRYGVVSTVDGAPLVFPGQELGISRTFGYQSYETNFGKQIAHFKKFNSLMPAWNDTNYGNDQLYPVYSGIGQARMFSPALRSSNRYFLDQTGGGSHGKIFSVAKFQAKNASPATSDVVFAFASTDRDYSGPGNFNVNQDTDADGGNDYGIKPARYYNVKNIAAYTAIHSNRRDIWQWRVPPYDEAATPQPRLGSDILANGIYVSMNRVPQTNGEWGTAPFEAQYLKLYDVTPPPAVGVPVPNLALYGTVLGNEITFLWTPANDPEGGISGYDLQIGSTPGAADLYDARTTAGEYALSVPYGTIVYARVRQVNFAGIAGPFSSASAAVMALDPAADDDGDGQSNAAEFAAGTDPRSAASVFQATAMAVAGNAVEVTAATVFGLTYRLETSTTMEAQSWIPVGSEMVASGALTVFSDPAGAGGMRRFYRVRVVR